MKMLIRKSTVLLLLISLESSLSRRHHHNRGRISPYAANKHRIVGGRNAHIGSHKFIASLQKNGIDGQTGHFCGGAIISQRAILTAAHCIYNKRPDIVRVVLGIDSLRQNGTAYNAEKLITHKKFQKKPARYDLGLVITREPIKFNDRVQFIGLPYYATEPGSEVYVFGWGRLSSKGSVMHYKLQELKLKTIALDDCADQFVEKNLILEHQICTLTRVNEGTCVGDSGGPLVDNKSVVGIVSWGRACARGKPDVFTQTHHFTNWIRKNMQ